MIEKKCEYKKIDLITKSVKRITSLIVNLCRLALGGKAQKSKSD